jgi:hypothetical protein
MEAGRKYNPVIKFIFPIVAGLTSTARKMTVLSVVAVGPAGVKGCNNDEPCDHEQKPQLLTRISQSSYGRLIKSDFPTNAKTRFPYSYFSEDF